MSENSTIVLITGANSGVGLAATGVIAGASERYHVIMAARSEEKAKKALAEVKALDGIQGSLSTILLDVNDQESISNAAKEVESKFGRVDVLVNNAGIAFPGSDTKADMEATFKTNVMGPALVAEAFEKLLLQSKRPYSIYTTSGLGSLGLAADSTDNFYQVPYSVYRMSKSALNMWAIQEHKNLGPKGVKTFVMCPGFVESNLRGTSEEERTAGGLATSPIVSGETMLSIIEGKRDADVGKFVHKDGVYPW